MWWKKKTPQPKFDWWAAGYRLRCLAECDVGDSVCIDGKFYTIKLLSFLAAVLEDEDGNENTDWSISSHFPVSHRRQA